MDSNKLDILEFNINRIDGYIEKADNKANFLLAFNGIIIGIIFSESTEILSFIKRSGTWKEFNTLIWMIMLGLILLSFGFSIYTIYPRKSKSNSSYKSILYYNDIRDLKKYKRLLTYKIKKRENIENEFSKQVVELSHICRKKMWCVNKSIMFLILFSIVFVIYGLIYSFNYIFQN